MSKKRLRFAPSPTGPLHIGGVRTALYNYLISKKEKGKFVLRIEDTDQKRFNKDAEKHIYESLEWCGILPDESPYSPGAYGPYRQSERKELYKKYVNQLIENNTAYYAFDSTESLNKERKESEKKGETFIYNWKNRERFKNSLSLDADTTKKYVEENKYVIRFKSYDNKSEKSSIQIEDKIRGSINVDLKLQDDKIIFKNDGMPTYHLANVIDDHLMEISDVVRGEEWLPSLALHWQLYDAFNWEKPNFAHLPLILKPTGKGKLSKRDGVKFGIPIYPIQWIENENLIYNGFKEIGFEKGAFINFISMIGWNPGNEDEIFNLNELIEKFDISRIIKSGAKYDFEKAKWFNVEHIKKISDKNITQELKDDVIKNFQEIIETNKVEDLLKIVKERVTFRKDIIEEINLSLEYNIQEFKNNLSRLNFDKNINQLLLLFIDHYNKNESIDVIKNYYMEEMKKREIKIGDGMKALRLCISGKLSGVDLFSLINIIKNDIIIKRINNSLKLLND